MYRKKLAFLNNKNCILLTNLISIWREEILTNLAILYFCIRIVVFVRSISLMMIYSKYISICSIWYAMFAVHNKNIVITKIMTAYKRIIKCLTTFVWKRIALTKNLLHLKLLINSKFIECKFMKNKIKKLILNNSVDFNTKVIIRTIKKL